MRPALTRRLRAGGAALSPPPPSCRCSVAGSASWAARRLSTAPKDEPPAELALSRAKMKRLREIAQRRGVETSDTRGSNPELVERILSANSGAWRAAVKASAEEEPAAEPAPGAEPELSEAEKQRSRAYYELIARLSAQGNDAAIAATLTRARSAGVDERFLEAAQKQEPMPGLGDGAPSAEARAQPDPELARTRAAQEAQLQAERLAKREQAERERLEAAARLEQAVREDARPVAEVKAACKALGISTTGKREALLRRLALHERWAEVSACQPALPLAASDSAAASDFRPAACRRVCLTG